MKRGFKVSRRDVLGTALTAAFAAALTSRPTFAEFVAAPGTHGIVPGSAEAQTAALQAALDFASRTGRPLVLPPGTYKTGCLSLKPRTHVQGVPGRTVLLADTSGSGIFETSYADAISLSGLVLDGGNAVLDKRDALVSVAGTTKLSIHDCEIRNSSKNGVSVRRASGRIAHCTFGTIAQTALSSEDADGLEINQNIVDTAAMGISIARLDGAGRGATIHNNRILNLFQRKIGACGGVGICVDADCIVSGNVIEGAPAYGVLVGASGDPGTAEVTANAIRNSHIGIGVSDAPRAGRILIAENLIDGSKDGGIRAMRGPRPIGPDLAQANEVTTRTFAVHANVSR